MQYNVSTKMYGWFYHDSLKKGLKAHKIRNVDLENIKQEYIKIIKRAKSIGKSRLMSAYCIAAYFIALNRAMGGDPEQNYEIFKDGLCANKLFHLALGKADSYLDIKKMPDRKNWAKESQLRKYQNDWVCEILEKNTQYDLGYNYYACGICALCKDEGCLHLAKYLCRLDYIMADIMGMKLVRTHTIAEGDEYCDFRYSKK